MRRKLVITVIVAFFGSVFTGSFSNASQFEISATSVKPIELKQINSKLRIVSLANGSAEILNSLGLRNSIVGRDIASTTPELKSIPIVTSGHQVIAEKVITLKPSLVIVDASVGPKSAIDAIKKAKIKVASIPEAWNLQDIQKKVAAIGNLIDEKPQASNLNRLMQQAIVQSKSNLGWQPRVVFLYLRGPSSIYLIGGPGSGADSLVSALGGVDVGAKTLKNPFNTLTSEALIAANPDVFLVMSKGLQSVGGISGFMKLPGVAQTNAGKAKKILSVDDSLLLSFGPRTPALLIKMSQALKAMK
jgi:iron complex transport system substrate-binding protein